jgi:hypothetical protein
MRGLSLRSKRGAHRHCDPQYRLEDFGADDWREPFNVLLKAIDGEADLNLFGRIWTRQDLLLFLEDPPADRGRISREP